MLLHLNFFFFDFVERENFPEKPGIFFRESQGFFSWGARDFFSEKPPGKCGVTPLNGGFESGAVALKASLRPQ